MERIRRPIETTGKCIRTETGCGHLYVIIGRDGEKIVEIFANLGKAGGCAKAQLEAVTRAVSLGLKYGIPLEDYVKEFIGIRCPSAAYDKKELNLSCADAIARVIAREFKIKIKEESKSNEEGIKDSGH